MKFLAAAAIALLMATPALGGPGTDSTAPSATPAPSPAAQPSPPPPAAKPANEQANAGKFVTKEGQDEWLVGNLWNRNVYDASGKSIGDVKDVLIDKDGKVAAIVIGVGGFLGLGEKNVAVDYNLLKQNGGISPNRIVLNMSEQDLRSAPSFNRSQGNK
jgi:sporulation protein YlmC with PRC-barrel domain